MDLGPTLEQIHSTLVSAYDGLKLSSGKYLTADNVRRDTISGGVYPFLTFSTGQFTLTRWNEYQEQISWTIPAKLIVQGPVEDGDFVARATMQDLLMQMKQIQGLPIDPKGALVPLAKTLRNFDTDTLTYLVDRGAPYIKSAAFTNLQDGITEVALTFTVEALLGFDNRTLPIMKVGVLGVQPTSSQGIYQDPSMPDAVGVVNVFGTASERGFGGYASGDPKFPYPTRAPIQAQGTSPAASDPNPVVAVTVNPYAAAISSGSPSTQLASIARYQNYQTTYVTAQAVWSSDTPAVATVSSTGLVSQVGAGTANVTCIFGGVQSNAVVITST